MALHHSSTIALHNGSVAPGSCSGVRHRGPVRVLAAVVVCCAAFAVQPLAEAQWVSGTISGTYDWGSPANWVGGTITNSISASSTATGDLTFLLSGTTFSSPIVFNAATSSGQRLAVFQASSATQTLDFNNGSGFVGNTTINNSSSMASSLILNLVSGTSAFSAGGSRVFTINSQITGAGSFAAGSSGQITLTNTANNFTGNLIVAQNGGSQDILAGTVGTFGSPANLIVNGNLLLNGSGTYAFNNFSGGSSGNVYKANGAAVSAVFAPTTVISSTYAGFIGNESINTPRQSGQMAVTKRGSGTLTLSTGTNAYSGPTTLEAGVLSIGRVANAGVTGTISGASTGTTGTIASTAGIQVGMNIFGLSGGLAGAAGYSGTVTAVTSATTFTVSNAWTGNGSNLGVLFGFYSPLGISTTSTSNLVFNGGSLRYSGSAGTTNRLFSIGTGGGGIIADGTTGQLVFSGTGTIGFNGQTGARVFTLSGSNTGTNTLANVLADNSGQTSLVKAGVGRWVLGGSHAYTGTTRIDAGTLTVGSNASIGSSRTVVVGTAGNARLDFVDAAYTFTGSQTLMGSGTVAGNGTGASVVTINGTLSPGNSPGVLTFNDTSVTLGSTGNVYMEITGSTRGTQYDAINIGGGINGGALNYGGTMTLNFTQTFTSGTFNLFQYEIGETTGSFAAIVFGGPSSQYAGTWTYQGGTSGLWTTGALSGTTTQMEFRQRVDAGGVSYGQLVIVPEPLMLGVLGIGSGVAVLGLRRLRRRIGEGSGEAS